MNGNLPKEEEVKIEDFIKTLNKTELLFLNRLVVERIKLLSQMETTSQMSDFSIGDTVEFKDHQNKIISGIIIKMNKKTISVLTRDSRQWNVHPSFLSRK